MMLHPDLSQNREFPMPILRLIPFYYQKTLETRKTHSDNFARVIIFPCFPEFLIIKRYFNKRGSTGVLRKSIAGLKKKIGEAHFLLQL